MGIISGEKMAVIKKINHVAIVVENLEESLKFWRDAMGLSLSHIEDVPSQKVQVAFLPVSEGEVELVMPTDDTTGSAKFLRDRGQGMHHLCLEVDDIEGMIAKLKAKGVRMINEIPEELDGRKMAFIHPKSACGVLVELYQII